MCVLCLRQMSRLLQIFSEAFPRLDGLVEVLLFVCFVNPVASGETLGAPPLLSPPSTF